MKHIVCFSGGKDSTAMLLMMLEKGMPVDEIVFCDTGKEFPQMYEHIKKVEEHIGREITILKSEKSFDYYFAEHVRGRGKSVGAKGYGWASMRIRWCTELLKIQPNKKYLKGKGEHKLYIGIAFDEPKRHENIPKNVVHPLYDWGITEAEALKYCYKHGFDWGGLYEHFHRVSCWCCPLKSIDELRVLYNKYPALWEELKDMDSRAFNQFRADYSVAQLDHRFWLENQQTKLF